jgi:hypothetical protein
MNILRLIFSTILSYVFDIDWRNKKMDHRLQPTIEALESTRGGDWTWSFYQNRRGVTGVWIQISHAGQFHKISVHDCRQRPEPGELTEAIRGIKKLDKDRTWIYENRRGLPGFSTTIWTAVPSQGSTSHAFMISRSHEIPK